MRIEGWHPVRLNEFVGKHWSVGAGRKKRDQTTVAKHAMAYRTTPALGRRRVDLTIVLAKGQRRPDKDAFWKSALDALAASKLLIDDNPDGCEPGTVTYKRSGTEAKWTEITLTDVEPAPPIEVLNAKPKRARKVKG